VGRIRYLGVLLYDGSRIEEVCGMTDESLVASQLSLILDPFDPEVIKGARGAGIPDPVIESARKSPVYRFVKEFEIALPLHPEFRTLPMLFYVPPLLPVSGMGNNGKFRLADDFFSSVESSRVPARYMADLFTAGDLSRIDFVLKKLMAVRIFKRAGEVGDIDSEEVARALEIGMTSPEEAEAIFRLTSLPTFKERFVIPPSFREMAIETLEEDAGKRKGEAGLGSTRKGERRW